MIVAFAVYALLIVIGLLMIILPVTGVFAIYKLLWDRFYKTHK